MKLNEAKSMLKLAGYRLIKEKVLDSDFYMELEDTLSDMGYNAKEIQDMMYDYSHDINDFKDAGASVDEIATQITDWYEEQIAANIDESFIKDDSGKVSVSDLVDKIMEKAGMVVDYDDDYTAAAYYIADFYSKQSLPINGMVMWGSRDLKKFKNIYDEQIGNATTSEEIQEYEKKAVTNVRSIMLGNPGKKWNWIEEIKDEYRAERKAAEEKRRQDYLNSEEYKRSQDPGWRGPNGTWSTD